MILFYSFQKPIYEYMSFDIAVIYLQILFFKVLISRSAKNEFPSLQANYKLWLLVSNEGFF